MTGSFLFVSVSGAFCSVFFHKPLGICQKNRLCVLSCGNGIFLFREIAQMVAYLLICNLCGPFIPSSGYTGNSAGVVGADGTGNRRGFVFCREIHPILHRRDFGPMGQRRVITVDFIPCLFQISGIFLDQFLCPATFNLQCCFVAVSSLAPQYVNST